MLKNFDLAVRCMRVERGIIVEQLDLLAGGDDEDLKVHAELTAYLGELDKAIDQISRVGDVLEAACS